MSDERQSRRWIDWGWAGSALDGCDSGDLHVVVEFDAGALVALVDGLGHGPEAAAAARAVVPVLEASPNRPVDEIVHLCHGALRGTRGAVMSLASFRPGDSTLAWTGVGNVDAVLLRAGGFPSGSGSGSRSSSGPAIPARPGVVGFQLPPLRANTIPIVRGDTLILVTDGIRGGFTTGVALDAAPGELAEAILAAHAKGTDDAHVLVARYLGGAA